MPGGSEVLALVLAGGNALGAFHGGVMEAFERESVWPDWVAGASIGGLMAAILAGNRPERRVAAARAFWSRAAIEDTPLAWVPASWQRPLHLTAALGTRLAGRPEMFHLRLGDLVGRRPGLYGREPMRRLLAELIDFQRLNSGAIRVSLMAVDVATGAEQGFDTASERLTLDHLMATSALLPDFPPVEIGGRWFVDGGLAANLPADLVLAEPAAGPIACFTADLFPLAAPKPARLADAAERQTDLIYACQTQRTLRAMRQLWATREAIGAVYPVAYAYEPGEIALKSYDFTRSSIDRRWQRGREAMARALLQWRTAPPSQPGLRIHQIAPLGLAAA